MIRAFLAALLFTLCLPAQAQQNLYVPNHISHFRGWPVIEYGDYIYYLSVTDLSPSAPAIDYYFSQVNKHNYQLERSIPVFRDTAFQPRAYLPYGISISYVFNEVTKRFSFFFVADADSAQRDTSSLRQYPRSIWLKQLDTALNTTMPGRPILRSDRAARYIVSGIESPAVGPDNDMVLTYQVFDTAVAPLLVDSWYANKLLRVDDSGRVLANAFLGREPNGLWSVYPISLTGKVYSYKDGRYAALAGYVDTTDYGYHSLFILDSNMQVINELEYPVDRYYGPQPADRHILYFEGYEESLFFLPGGRMVRSSIVEYVDVDTATTKYYQANAVIKVELDTAYRDKKIYLAPRANDIDKSHAAMGTGYMPAISHYSIFDITAYNKYDQRIYAFSSTSSSLYYGDYCMNYKPNLGQIAAIDTDMVEKWVKYLRPAPGHCIIGTAVYPAAGRNGAIITGWQASLPVSGDISTWQPFIYHIDSTTELGLGMNNPESPVMISSQFTLYPNPAVNHTVIENVLGTAFSYAIINNIGQVVARAEGEGLRTRVDLQDLPVGVYMVRIITTDQKSHSLKFMKE